MLNINGDQNMKHKKISEKFLVPQKSPRDFLGCPHCQSKVQKVEVNVAGAQHKVVSYQCSQCDYFEFEPLSSKKVIEELRETPLKIKQKVVKLSQDRLGIYFNSHIVRSLGIQKGEDIYISVPDKRHLILELPEKYP